MNEFQELEFKYKADDIKLEDFRALMRTLGVTKQLDTSSWDIYYVKDENDFIRFRNGDEPELTKKKKVKDSNNWSRVECDLPLDRKRVAEPIVDQFATMSGYTKNFKIYKSCFIYWTDHVNYVYYIVYNEDLKELGRYVEVEVNKDKIPEMMRMYNMIKQPKAVLGTWKEADALKEAEVWLPENILNQAEKAFKQIGLSPQNRMKKSLFEMYKK